MSPMATPASAAMERKGVPAKPLAAKRWRPALRMRARPVRSLPSSCDPSWAAAVAMSSPLPFRIDPVPALAHACSCLLLRAGPAHRSRPILPCPRAAVAPARSAQARRADATRRYWTFFQQLIHSFKTSDLCRTRQIRAVRPAGDRSTRGDRVTDQTPLNGITVLTLAVNLPGPLAAARLTQLGARVIKVEPPNGDPLESAVAEYYRELTEGQEIRRVDLKTADGAKEL